MFNKNKLASGIVVALAAGLSPAVLAANAAISLGSTPLYYSPEAKGTATVVTADVSVFTLGQDLVVNDEVWLTASGALNAATEWPANLVVCAPDDDANTITMTRYSNTTTLGKYRLTTKTDGADGTAYTTCGKTTAQGAPTQTEDSSNDALTLVGANIVLAGQDVAYTTKASVSITMATKTTGGGQIDVDAAATPLVWQADELTASVTTSFDGKIDVDQSEKALTVATDIVAVTFADAADGVNADYNSATIAIAGDWSWMDSDATTAGMQIATTTHGTATHAVTGTGNSCTALANGQFNAAMSTWTIPCTIEVDGSVTTTITPDAQLTGGVIPEQTYTVTVSTVYDTANTTAGVTEIPVAALTAFGSWAKNNASLIAYSVPFSTSVTRMLWVANVGTTAAAVTASVEADGVTYGPYAMGNAAGQSQLAIGQLLDTALAGDAAWVAAAYTSRANVTVTAATSTTNVVLSAGYYSTGDKDRQMVETSDSLN